MNYRENKSIKDLLAKLFTEEERVTGNITISTPIEKKRIA